MERDLRKLIDDHRFQKYHEEFLNPREFNAFDVLRYADYEIRHSNVLAWLLKPGETHGIGGEFLKWFVKHVNEQLSAANSEPLPEGDFDAANVDVERELDYVDITVFLKKEKCLIAIENKTVLASSEHYKQVRRYEQTLRGKYRDHKVKSVLLTSSPDGGSDSSGIAHVGWEDVRKTISSIDETGKFSSCGVSEFVRQYVDLLRRWLHPGGGEGFKTLLVEYDPILKPLRLDLEKSDGDKRVAGMVPEDLKDYRNTLVRLVRESRQDPIQVRWAVACHLRGLDITVKLTHNREPTYWAHWTEMNLAKAARSLGGKDDSLQWVMAFTYQEVRMGFYLYQESPEEQVGHSPMGRLKSFIQATPINRLEPNKYPMRDNGNGWFQIFDEVLLSNDELADLSGSDVNKEVPRRLKDFMDSDESEYRRIDDYIKCLAFRPCDSASKQEDSP